MNRRTPGRGFSLIELVIVLGLVMMLAGLMAPTLAGAREQARTTRTAIAVRNCAQAVSLYMDDRDDVFPLASDRVGASMLDWEIPLLASGYLGAYAQIDPEGMREMGHHRFALSGALTHPARQMEPGATVPLDVARTVAIRQAQVVFPSEKGMLVQWVHSKFGEDVFWTWNPYDRPMSPMAFCDGAVIERRCTDFRLAHDYFENWVGHPVLATWSGHNGLDRTE